VIHRPPLSQIPRPCTQDVKSSAAAVVTCATSARPSRCCTQLFSRSFSASSDRFLSRSFVSCCSNSDTRRCSSAVVCRSRSFDARHSS